MSSRPPMHARDASGRQVSLLNDEPTKQPTFSHVTYSSYDDTGMKRTNSYVSASSSSPPTPGLLRADSYDSQMSGFSPLTPTSLYEYGRQSSSYTTSAYPDPSQFDQHQSIYGVYHEKPQSGEGVRPNHVAHSSSSYDEDATQGNLPDRQGAGKRYPCRYKDSHNCDKTFTTSGHASRHSKIHTAEKAVNCSFAGCQKKFTRADNMKQHLETHYKERSRASQKASSTGNKLSMSAGVRKRSPTPQSHRPSSRSAMRRDSYTYDSYAQFSSPAATESLPSPVSPHCTLDMDGFHQALPNHHAPPRMPTHQRTDSATFRLDALASIASDSR